MKLSEVNAALSISTTYIFYRDVSISDLADFPSFHMILEKAMTTYAVNQHALLMKMIQSVRY